MNILYEDNHLLVVDKPAGMPTMGASAGAPSVHAWAAEYIKRRYDKPGKAYIGIVSRLDRLTTGVLVLARTSKAASRLTAQFGGPSKRGRRVQRAEKCYLAAVAGDLIGDASWSPRGRLTDSIYKDDPAHRMRVDRRGRADARQAELEYVVVAGNRDCTVVAIRLLTGRKHQIRLQFADRGHPLLGDRKYGSIAPFEAGVALHSLRLLITHPTRKHRMQLQAAIPASWQSLPGVVADVSEVDRVIHQHWSADLEANASSGTDP